MALKLITFDVTGTLLVLRESVGQVYARVGSKHGIAVSPNALNLSFNIIFKKMLLDYPNFGENGIGWPEWWKKLVIGTFAESLPNGQNQAFNSLKYEKISSELIEMYKTDECWTLANGARDLLEKLAGEAVHLGVISNYDPRLENILENLKIRKYFEFVVTSYSAKCSKPDPAIFKKVENIFKTVDRSKILHIGDNVKLDFNGAKNIGWNAVLVTKDLNRLRKNYPEIDTDRVVTDLDNIYPCLLAKRMLSISI